MTIIDLQESGIVFQGPVRVSSVEDGHERVHLIDTLYCGFDVSFGVSGELDQPWLEMPVTYMFVGADGALHIEVDNAS